MPRANGPVTHRSISFGPPWTVTEIHSLSAGCDIDQNTAGDGVAVHPRSLGASTHSSASLPRVLPATLVVGAPRSGGRYSTGVGLGFCSAAGTLAATC